MEGQRVTREKLLKLTDTLAETTQTDWVSVYLRPDTLESQRERLIPNKDTNHRLMEVASFIEAERVQRELRRYGTGLVLFYSEDAALAVVPPIPVTDDLIVTGAPHTKPLRESLERQQRVVLVLVTWGAYVVALYTGGSLVRYKKGTGHIHARHKKGGSSQARFARRTEEQRKEFLKRVARHIDEELGTAQVERIYFGGNRLILKLLVEESRFLRDRAALLSPRTLLVKRATGDTMDSAIAEAYSAVVFQPNQ